MKAENRIDLKIDNKGKGRRFESRFLEAGLVKYSFGVCLLNKDALNNFVYKFVGCPVIIDHKDITDENAKDERVGVISKVWYNEFDGWFWCEGVLFDDEAISLIKDKGYNVSCQYNIDDYIENTAGELHNGNPYDLTILDGTPEHLAIVKNPRYEEALIAVNKGEEMKAENTEFRTGYDSEGEAYVYPLEGADDKKSDKKSDKKDDKETKQKTKIARYQELQTQLSEIGKQAQAKVLGENYKGKITEEQHKQIDIEADKLGYGKLWKEYSELSKEISAPKMEEKKETKKEDKKEDTTNAETEEIKKYLSKVRPDLHFNYNKNSKYPYEIKYKDSKRFNLKDIATSSDNKEDIYKYLKQQVKQGSDLEKELEEKIKGFKEDKKEDKKESKKYSYSLTKKEVDKDSMFGGMADTGNYYTNGSFAIDKNYLDIKGQTPKNVSNIDNAVKTLLTDNAKKTQKEYNYQPVKDFEIGELKRQNGKPIKVAKYSYYDDKLGYTRNIFINKKYNDLFKNFDLKFGSEFSPVYAYDGKNLIGVVMPINAKEQNYSKAQNEIEEELIDDKDQLKLDLPSKAKNELETELKRFMSLIAKNFDESKHDRDKDGKFTDSGNFSGESVDEQEAELVKELKRLEKNGDNVADIYKKLTGKDWKSLKKGKKEQKKDRKKSQKSDSVKFDKIGKVLTSILKDAEKSYKESK